MYRALIIFTILVSILYLGVVTCFCAFVGDSVQIVEEGFTNLSDFDHGKQHCSQGSSKSESEGKTGLE